MPVKQYKQKSIICELNPFQYFNPVIMFTAFLDAFGVDYGFRTQIWGRLRQDSCTGEVKMKTQF